jgi:glutaredoxin
MSTWDSLRAKAHGRLEKLSGGLGDRLRGLNEALGRPLASSDELADRKAFEQGLASPTASASARASVAAAAAAGAPPAVSPEGGKTAAPVIVYHLDKHRSQLPRLTQTLDGADIPYRILNLEGDAATQGSVKRDSNNRKLPLVFIAGECVGGRDELHAMERSGLLKKKVWGG